MMDLARLCQQAITICELAGREIAIHYGRDEKIAPTFKLDHSPVTEADLASHRIIAQQLSDLKPNFPLLSEEGNKPDENERANWQTYWLVDPLDGTKEYIARTGDFSVNLALIDGGIPIIGIIHLPLEQKTYFAYRDGGAWQANANQKPSQIKTRSAVKPFVLVASRHANFSYLPLALQKFCNDPLQAQPLRRLGSAAKFGLVAAGEVDVYLRLSPTMQWDTAAGDCIVREAGGITCQLNGQPLSYHPLGPFENSNFVCLGDANYLEEFLLLLKS